MKITFEGKTLNDVLDQMEAVLDFSKIPVKQREIPPAPPVKAAQGPGPDAGTPMDIFVDMPVDTPVEKAKPQPKPDRSEKQKAAAAKMRAAKEAKKAKAAASIMPEMPVPPPPKSAEGMDPAEVVRIRQKTIEELQAAYANGFDKEVFELLARFGNGAKSFRELTPEAFVPIREAIDNGALT